MLLPSIHDVVARRSYRPDEVDVFLFSAACWLPHRVHFDRRFAQSEGLKDVPVQGPLQTAWLTEMLDGWARGSGGRAERIEVRNVASAYPGDELVAELAVTSVLEGVAEVIVELSATVTRDADVITSGTARALFSVPRIEAR